MIDSCKASARLEFLRRGEKCICCGTVPVEYDHIVSRILIRKQGRILTQPGKQLQDYDNGCTQFLCENCNRSKGDSARCGIHNKYLGIWNYLPKLDNMEIA